MFSEIAPDIFAVEHQVAEGKNGIIFGGRATLAIDAGTHLDEGQVMLDLIQARERTPDYLIFTHGHPDHVLGSGAFTGAKVIAHSLTPAEIRRLLPKWAEMYDTSVAQLEAQIAWPTLTFSDELRLDLGGRYVRLFPTPGHSQDGISVYVEEDRMLIAGDAVVTSIVPAIGDGDSRVLETTLHKLLAMDIEVLMPGHGQVVHGADKVQDALEWIINYLIAVRDSVQGALGRGLEPNAIADQVGYDQFIGDHLPKDKYKMPSRHRDTVNKIIKEEIEIVAQEK